MTRKKDAARKLGNADRRLKKTAANKWASDKK